MHDRAVWTLNKLNRADKENTSSLSRGHVIEISDSGLVSLMGGKWTAYRKMGSETVD
jgi:glycerol-3-phosphate dehydrogenase